MSEDYFEANRNLVRGEPFFGFGELWEQLAPDIEKQIRKFIDEGEYFGKFKCPGDGEEGIYIDYPDLGAPVKARIVIAQEKGQYTLASAYPAGAGLARELKIDATFDGADGLYGIVEASADEGPTLNFFVPDYETSRESLTPGERNTLKISGFGLNAKNDDAPPPAIESGSFYESQLAEFLKDNPDKTAADFTAREIIMDKCVISLPEETTCWARPGRAALRLVGNGIRRP